MACNAHTVPLTTAEGDAISLKDLVLKRVFIPLEQMRRPEVDVTHEEEEIRKARLKLREVQAMSPAQCDEAAQREYHQALRTKNELDQSYKDTVRRFERARVLLQAWAIQSVVEEFKARLLKELEEDWPKPTSFVPVRITGSVWQANTLAHHMGTIAFYEDRITEQRQTAEKNQRWAEALCASLDETPPTTKRSAP
jgi:hypothetical protein